MTLARNTHAAVKTAHVGPRIVTVYRDGAGALHHTRCHHRLEFRRRRGLEIDFYCLKCCEHVSLPEHVLGRVPALAVLDALHTLRTVAPALHA